MSPKSKEQFEEIRNKSIAAIKEAALELFAHNGYHGTSISQIARSAGISKGLLYNYFDSKQALLETIVLEAVHLGERLMEGQLSRTNDPFDQLRGIIEDSKRMLQSNLHYWKLFTALAFQTDTLSSLAPLLKRKQEIAQAQLVDIFTRMEIPEPEKEAYFFTALLDGVFLHYLLQEDSYPLDKVLQTIFDRYFN